MKVLSNRSVFAILIISFFILVLFVGGGCSLSSGGGSSTAVSGTFSTAATKALAAEGSRSVLEGDEIWVYSLDDGQAVSVDNHTVVSIGSDGSFSFSVVDGEAFVAILVDPSAEFDKAVGVIGISTGENQYWEKIDTSQTEGDILLGEIPDIPVNGILISGNSIAQIGATIADIDSVRQFAHLDGVIGFLLNQINGSDRVSTSVSYVFGQSDIGLTTITGNAAALPSKYTFAGYQIVVNVTGSTGTESVKLVPPSEVSYGNDIYTLSDELTGNYFSFDDQGHFEFGQGDKPGDALLWNAPPGIWALNVDDVHRADFQYGVVSPTLETSILFPVPLFHVVTQTGTDIIESISVSWVLANDTGGYDSISPDDLVKIFDKNSFYFELADFSVSDTGYREGFSFVPGAEPFYPVNEWHVSAPVASGHWAELLDLSYAAGRVGVRFAVRQDS